MSLIPSRNVVSYNLARDYVEARGLKPQPPVDPPLTLVLA